MRIVLISPYFPPQHAVASLRIWSMAREWAQAGEDVTVLTTTKRVDQRGMDLPCGGFQVREIDYHCPKLLERIRSSDHAGSTTTEPNSGSTSSGPGWLGALRRLRSRSGVYSSVRMPDLTDYWIKPAVKWAMENGPWDVAVSSCGPYTAHLVAMTLRRERRVDHWAADFRDLWTKNHHFRGLFPFVLRERQLERRCLREADLVCTVTEGFARSLETISGRPVEVIYNGHTAENDADLPPEPIFPRDGVVRLVYTGTLYPPTQDPLPVLRAMASLKQRGDGCNSRIQLVIAGKGCDWWAKAARSCGISDLVETRGIVSRDDALRMQRDADALLLMDLTDPDRGFLPAKVFEYLSRTAPILVAGGSRRSELGRLVERAGRGVHLGSDAEAIQEFISDLLGDRTATLPARNDSVIESLSRRRQSMRLLEMMRDQFAGASPG